MSSAVGGGALRQILVDASREPCTALGLGMIATGACVFVTLLFLSAPYGRHTRGGWGPLVNAKLMWFLQESPNVYVVLWLLRTARPAVVSAWSTRLLLGCFLWHYVYRSLIYPLLTRQARPVRLAALVPLELGG